MINVFNYIDYRKLLKDLYDSRKKENSSFSYRYIGQKVGFKSAGFFTNILNGKRNISSKLTFKLAELFNFNKKETEYFELLVLYNQADNHAQRKFYYEKMLAACKASWQQLAASQYEYFDNWYYVAIREILGFYKFRGDFKELAQLVRPSISPRQAKQAIDVLERIGLIEKDSEGVYQQTSKALTTGDFALPLVAIHNFQLSTLDLAKDSLDRIPREERHISTLSFCASDETYQKISKKLAEFRQDVRDLIKKQQGPINKAYHFNFSCFPISNAHVEDDS